jgi:hypothetical protein
MSEPKPLPVPQPPNRWACDMTLRDYFAAKAMQALVVGPQIPAEAIRPGGALQDGVARMAYAAADAMLKAREDA